MTWGHPLAKVPSSELEPWDTNERIQAEWEAYVSKRGAKNTQRNLRTYPAVFFRSFEEPVTELGRQDVQNFVDHISKKCKHLMLSDPPQCLWKHAIATCPLLQGDDPARCQDYTPLQPSGVLSYITAVNRMYNWLISEGRLGINPAYPVMKDFQSRHSAWFDERRRKPVKRRLSLDEVKLLVTHSPIHHGTAYLLMAKCFMREHEVHKLRWHPEFCDLEEGWMDIPANWELGDKRLGCVRIILDSELRHWLRNYRQWWEDKVKRDEDGNPLTDRVILTQFGMPWGKGGLGNFNSALTRRAVALELQPKGRQVPREQRVQSHSFRAFATTSARDAGASDADVLLLRGDLGGGTTLVRYDDYLRRLPGLYANFAPVLQLD